MRLLIRRLNLPALRRQRRDFTAELLERALDTMPIVRPDVFSKLLIFFASDFPTAGGAGRDEVLTDVIVLAETDGKHQGSSGRRMEASDGCARTRDDYTRSPSLARAVIHDTFVSRLGFRSGRLTARHWSCASVAHAAMTRPDRARAEQMRRVGHRATGWWRVSVSAS